MKPSTEKYDNLRRQGIAEMDAGNYTAALARFEGCLREAERLGDTPRTHAARVNVSLIRLETQDYRSAERGLREILLQSRDDRTAAVAALILSQSLAKQYEMERAQEYLRIAMERARRAGARKTEAEALNLSANISVISGNYAGAIESYSRALAIYRELHETGSFVHQLILENLGYALLLSGETSQAIALMAESLRSAEKLGQRRVIAVACQDLGFAMMQANRLRRAETYCLRAMAEATRNDYGDVVKNCLFILMEVSLRRNDEEKFDHYFNRLQQMFPEIRLSRSFFQMFDISDIINLKEI